MKITRGYGRVITVHCITIKKIKNLTYKELDLRAKKYKMESKYDVCRMQKERKRGL